MTVHRINCNTTGTPGAQPLEADGWDAFTVQSDRTWEQRVASAKRGGAGGHVRIDNAATTAVAYGAVDLAARELIPAVGETLWIGWWYRFVTRSTGVDDDVFVLANTSSGGRFGAAFKWIGAYGAAAPRPSRLWYYSDAAGFQSAFDSTVLDLNTWYWITVGVTRHASAGVGYHNVRDADGNVVYSDTGSSVGATDVTLANLTQLRIGATDSTVANAWESEFDDIVISTEGEPSPPVDARGGLIIPAMLIGGM